MRIKDDVHISKESQKERSINESRSKDLGSMDGILPEQIEDEDEFDDANADFNKVYYNDNPDAVPLVKIINDDNGNVGLKKDKSTYDSRIKEGKIIVNQSLIKKIIDRYQNEVEFCPAYIKEVFIKKNKLPISLFFEGKCPEMESMTKGKFFESLCYGSTTDSDLVLDLPRSKRKGKLFGSKTLDQQRIEQQAERFKLRCKTLNVDIVPGHNIHQVIFKRWNDKYMLAGEFDMFPIGIYYEEALRLAIIDLKLTTDVHSTFGSFCWGKPQFMDHIQADMYQYLVRNIDLELNPHLKDVITDRTQDIINRDGILFLYWVFGYREPLEQQEIFVERSYKDENGTMHRQNDLNERIRKTIAVLEREEQFGWEEKPVQDNCKYCPLNQRYGGSCKSSIVYKV